MRCDRLRYERRYERNNAAAVLCYARGVVYRMPLLAVFGAVVCLAQGTPPREKVAGYPVHSDQPDFSIGASYLVRSVLSGKGSLETKEYLVVEVALFPLAGHQIKVTDVQFTLRINGGKRVLSAQAPEMVAAAVKYPDWEQRKGAEMDAGVGNAGVVLGRPQPVPRFPGDPTAPAGLPPINVPDVAGQAGIARDEPDPPDVIVTKTALPEGPTGRPVSGYLYFPFRGKPKSVRALDLIYAAPAGEVVLKLR